MFSSIKLNIFNYIYDNGGIQDSKDKPDAENTPTSL